MTFSNKKQKNAVSRRAFLKTGAAAAVVAVVGGVGGFMAFQGSQAPSPAAPATPAPAPAVTPAPQVGPIPAEELSLDTWGLVQGEDINYYTTAHSGWYYNVEDNLSRYMNKTGSEINIFTDDFVTFHDKLAATFASGVYAFDVTYEWGAWLQEFLEFYTPLDELGIQIPPEIDADVVPYSKDTVTFKGERYYALPRMYEVLTIQGNVNQLQESGLTDWPQDFETFTEHLEILKGKFKDIPDYHPFAAGFGQGYLLPHYLAWLHCNGGGFWSNDTERTILCDSRESIRAIEDMKFLYDNYMNPAAIEWIFSIQAGKEWFLDRSTYMMYYPHVMTVGLPQFRELGYPLANESVTTGILPGKRGVVRSASLNAPEGYGIPRTAKNVRASWDLIKFLHSKETQVQMTLHMGPTPDLEEPFPTRWSYYFDERFKVEPWRTMITTQLEQSKYRCSRYIRPAYQAITVAVEAEITNALKGIKTAEDAMKDAREKTDQLVEEEVGRYGGGYWDPWVDDKTRTGMLRKIDEVLNWYEA